MRAHGMGIGVVCTTVILLGADVAFAQTPPQGPCGQITAACRQAGFVQGGRSAGDGLQIDCVRPIMQGGAQPRRAGPRMPCYGLTLTQPYRVLVGSTPMAR